MIVKRQKKTSEEKEKDLVKETDCHVTISETKKKRGEKRNFVEVMNLQRQETEGQN
jgi:hypothetical protein